MEPQNCIFCHDSPPKYRKERAALTGRRQKLRCHTLDFLVGCACSTEPQISLNINCGLQAQGQAALRGNGFVRQPYGALL